MYFLINVCEACYCSVFRETHVESFSSCNCTRVYIIVYMQIELAETYTQPTYNLAHSRERAMAITISMPSRNVIHCLYIGLLTHMLPHSHANWLRVFIEFYNNMPQVWSRWCSVFEAMNAVSKHDSSQGSWDA